MTTQPQNTDTNADTERYKDTDARRHTRKYRQKQKGNRDDKNTWRGITLLSVGSKLVARIVASRISQWSEEWLCEEQSGFRRGRGTDDALQVARRIIEDVLRLRNHDVITMTMFDIEKAYPRVCRPALWRLMRERGCPPGIVRVCRALHEHTSYKVRFCGGVSSEWAPNRGLREGCPSSPPLFNVYHDAVM